MFEINFKMGQIVFVFTHGLRIPPVGISQDSLSLRCRSFAQLSYGGFVRLQQKQVQHLLLSSHTAYAFKIHLFVPWQKNQINVII